MNVALITAAGTGQRMQQEIPKQFLHVLDKPVIIYTLEAFERHAGIDAIAVVCLEGWETILATYARQYGITKLKHIIQGGKNGQDSIRNGLFEIEKHYAPDDLVLVHDGNRPMISQGCISDCIDTTKKYGSAITVIPCQEAMLTTEDQVSSCSAIARHQLKRTQTPQGFPIARLCAAHRDALERGITNSVACCTLMIELGETLYFSAGSEKNIKLTTLEDMEIFKALLMCQRNSVTSEGEA